MLPIFPSDKNVKNFYDGRKAKIQCPIVWVVISWVNSMVCGGGFLGDSREK